ncbi:MAG TPA: hypothetical protein PLS11_08995, partial [Ottowia sp.]|nr:hypothetical protein [Ottowia sp.]
QFIQADAASRRGLIPALEFMKKRSKKRKPSELTKLKKRLARLQSDIATVTSEITKKKLLVQILLTEEKIKIEEFHKVSGFNKIRGYEILSGAPGLGKRS